MITNKKDKSSVGLNYFLVVLVVLALVGIGYFKNAKSKTDKQREQINFINALSDSVKLYKQRDSSQKATISSLVMSNNNTFINILSYDSTIIALQDEVKEYKNQLKPGSAVVIGETKTYIKGGGKTIINALVDTTHKWESFSDSSGLTSIHKVKLLKPSFIYNDNNKWMSIHITTEADSTKFDLSVVNRYAVVLGYINRKPFADVINYNPYSSTKILRSYQVSVPKQKPWGIGFSSGFSVSTGLKIQPYIGIGVNYNILNF